MAIFKAIKNPSIQKGGAKSALDYVGKKSDLTLGINCSDDYDIAFQEFEENFKNSELALEVSKKFCEKEFKDHEVFLSVHNDSNNLHCHMIVNSVNFVNGKKHNQKKKDLTRYKELINEIGLEHRIQITKKIGKEIGDVTTDTKEKRKAIENHFNGKERSDIVNTYSVLTRVLETEKIKSIDDFKEKMDKEGIILDWQPQRKHITLEVKEEFASSLKRKFRLSNLNKTFNDPRLTKENLEFGFEYTKQIEQERNKEYRKE
ncbi:relaxase/mobilization nuclease domain-containing protein [uncultured Cetobacterium sp.]|uniref:relaxase/mobilization nuclease domain-containing protein n=1 Tax=uncultured Cetobacterium sp. TaxID=527638 RepID=UPI00260E3E75|nr:relaxase/mobilization nuclease domain-containing protein [uncultured Cetobacterium sp.]